jgi:hypothetical protein
MWTNICSTYFTYSSMFENCFKSIIINICILVSVVQFLLPFWLICLTLFVRVNLNGAFGLILYFFICRLDWNHSISIELVMSYFDQSILYLSLSWLPNVCKYRVNFYITCLREVADRSVHFKAIELWHLFKTL